MTGKFDSNRVGRRIDLKGNTQGKDGEGRRIIVNNFPRGTTIPEIEEFFGPDRIEGITLYEYIAFIQFKRPQHHTDALLMNLTKFKSVKIVIKNYKTIKKEPGRKRSRSPPARPIRSPASRPAIRAMRSRSRSRSPRREHGRRIYRSPSIDRRRAIEDRRRPIEDRRRSIEDVSPSVSRRNRSPPRSVRHRSSSRSSRHLDGHRSPSRSSRNLSLARNSNHSMPRDERHGWSSSGYVEYSESHSHSQSHQLVIRPEDGPMAGVFPQNMTASSSSFLFGTNSVPISTFPGCVSQPQPRPFIPAPNYTSPENKPSTNLGRIFSEGQDLKVAIVNDSAPTEQPEMKSSNLNGVNGSAQTNLPDHIDLLLKLIIAQRTPYSLSLSQLNDLQQYFANVTRQVELQMHPSQMPQTGDQPNSDLKTASGLANGDGGKPGHVSTRESEVADPSDKNGKSNDEKPSETDLKGDADEIAMAIANKIRRLNRG